jgi:hypothetical protein
MSNQQNLTDDEYQCGIISRNYFFRLTDDKPTILDKISKKRIEVLSHCVSKDIAIMVENYSRYDWFNIVSEAIMLNVCGCEIEFWAEKEVLKLQTKVRERLMSCSNGILSRTRAFFDPYPLKEIIKLFKRHYTKNEMRSVEECMNILTDFEGIFYRKYKEDFNQEKIIRCRYTIRLILHSAIANYNIKKMFGECFLFRYPFAMKISVYKMLWPYGLKRNYFYLPEVNYKDNSGISVAYDNEGDYRDDFEQECFDDDDESLIYNLTSDDDCISDNDDNMKDFDDEDSDNVCISDKNSNNEDSNNEDSDNDDSDNEDSNNEDSDNDDSDNEPSSPKYITDSEDSYSDDSTDSD